MVRSRPRRCCRVPQIASTRALAAVDCLRRSRSSRRNPPAERRLKNATPSSHASTSQGRASSEGAKREIPNDVSTTALPETLGCVRALEYFDDPDVLDDMPEEVRK